MLAILRFGRELEGEKAQPKNVSSHQYRYYQFRGWRVLCLHGGGGNAESFPREGGMPDLMAALPEFEFVFANAPHNYGGNALVWMRDVPGGKSSVTTDPDWDLESREVLDAIVEAQGPFDAILGYSQGGAYILAYVAWAPVGTFKAALVFCGYVPSLHLGIVDRIDSSTPLGVDSSLVFMGEQDTTITNEMTQEAATKFAYPTVVSSAATGHYVPYSSDPSFSDIIAFMNMIPTDGETPIADATTSPIPSPDDETPIADATTSPTLKNTDDENDSAAPTTSPSVSPNPPPGTKDDSSTTAMTARILWTVACVFGLVL
ncbi:hypothetical protein CYMTET_48859 [Cymbomonas tetramitiformis]|uniref:Serine hydrolase domain-containing protein n=1 Tax=Cymbomonas tetramitiformis TaxID=36881 RepID=A0AAE0BSH5_9CHLO|nr:hypothetical protein CYMTET_48859 [Cymbomonas tetramitiformis]